jgi:hypothetical protein
MTIREEHVSPDGLLRLLVVREPDDITIGFDGFTWHTHGDVIAGELELLGEPKVVPEEAVERFVGDLLSGNVAIGIVRVGDKIRDIWATYLPDADDPYQPKDEVLELRRWDGTPWPAS